MKIFVTGLNKLTNETFDLKIKSRLATDIMNMAETGQDERIDRELRTMGKDTDKALVLEALTWIDFTEEAIKMIQSGDRFAVSASNVDFGISGRSFNDAGEALVQEEF